MNNSVWSLPTPPHPSFFEDHYGQALASEAEAMEMQELCVH